MKINVGLVAEAAAKKPSPKAVQKAANTLKNAKKAKAGDVKSKLQDLIDQATSIYKDADSQQKVDNASIAKLEAQLQKLHDQAESRWLKTSGKAKKLMPRIAKLQAEYIKHGGKNIIPDILAEDVPDTSAAKDKSSGDVAPPGSKSKKKSKK